MSEASTLKTSLVWLMKNRYSLLLKIKLAYFDKELVRVAANYKNDAHWHTNAHISK